MDPDALLHDRPLPGCSCTTMTVLAAESIPCAAADWSAAVVVVLRGQLLLECLSGRCSTFAEGAVLPLSGLHLRRITNIGLEPLVLRTIRRDPSS